MNDMPFGGEGCTRIKFCGMTRAEDVQAAVHLGVDFIGLIFAMKSKRKVTLEQAVSLRQYIPRTTAVVALCMDNAADEVSEIVEKLQPDYLQFHGREEDAFCAQFARPFFKVIAMADAQPAKQQMACLPSAYGFVLDGHALGEAGGSGQTFDWAGLPTCKKPMLLAGGLSPANVSEAIRDARPWGVDVSSGIERMPGIKDPQKMRDFVAAVRMAA
jgi:phosphoribosylanthranilate isomerase